MSRLSFRAGARDNLGMRATYNKKWIKPYYIMCAMTLITLPIPHFFPLSNIVQWDGSSKSVCLVELMVGFDTLSHEAMVRKQA